MLKINRQKAFRWLSAMSLILVASGAYARPVTPEEACQRALDFASSPSESAGIFKAPAINQGSLEIAYTAKAGDLDCFYVVNLDNGFIIVSADTRLSEVLGYSDNGQFDFERISPDLKWWLSEYENEISSWLPNAPEISDETIAARKAVRRAERAPIAPLVSTRWDQGTPFNNDCPMDPNYNRRSATGCVATAMSQIMKFHNWPKKPTGSNGGVIFSGTTLDWDNMIDVYTEGKYTSTQAAAVAQLMRQCGAAVDMQYSYYASGAYDNRVQNALRTYFGYASDIQMHWKDYTMQRDWNNMVYAELAAGRPVYYSGSSSRGGHAFVCDGYSANEYYHFNWGWGGYQDGFYRLTALNPETGGAGSYEGGYNSHQTIMTGIVPSRGQTATQSTILATGSFYYENGRYTTEDSTMPGYDLFYNPLYTTLQIYIGLKVVNASTPDAKPTYVMCGDKVNLPANYGTTEFSGSIPTLPDGTYHVYGVFSTNGKDWQDIQIPVGKQNFVTLTVTGGRQSFSNEGPDASLVPNIIMGTPQTTSVLPASADKYFRIPFINTGKGDFLGEIGVSLFGDDEFGDVISINNSVSVPGESSAIIEFSAPQSVEPGEYRMYVTDSEGNTLSEQYTFIFTEDVIATPDSDLSAGELSPNFYTTGDERMMYATLVNNGVAAITTGFTFNFVDPKTGKILGSVSTQGKGTVEGSSTQRLAFGPLALNLEPGEYLWYITDENGKTLSYTAPMIVESPIMTSGKISYVVTDSRAKEVAIVAPEGDPYTGEIIVPNEIEGNTVTQIRQDAFAFATATDISLPKGVSSLEDGGFYNDTYLHYLHISYDGITDKMDCTFNPSRKGKMWVDIRSGNANTYARDSRWSSFLFPFWHLQPGEGTAFVNVEMDPATDLPYSPYYVGADEPMMLSVTAPAGKNVIACTIIEEKDWRWDTIDPLTTQVNVPALGFNGGRITIEATSDEVAVETIDADDIPSDIFSIDGRIILRNATQEDLRNLEPGIYIYRGRKISVK